MTRAAVGVALVVAALSTLSVKAHKGITSKFTYNAEVFPVFLSRCGKCHVDGGVGPMSLLTYEDAFPWAESLRTELLAAFSEDAEPARRSSEGAEAAIKAAHRQISARELDIILDWATGGTPEGDKSKVPPQISYTSEWSRGMPNLMIGMTQPLELPADTSEKTQEVVLPIPIDQPRSAGQLDLVPGNAAIVRSAEISIRSRDGHIRMLATWFPRQTPAPLALRPVARLEPGSELIVRLHYKKTWKFEGKPMSDQSTVGFYFAD